MQSIYLPSFHVKNNVVAFSGKTRRVEYIKPFSKRLMFNVVLKKTPVTATTDLSSA